MTGMKPLFAAVALATTVNAQATPITFSDVNDDTGVPNYVSPDNPLVVFDAYDKITNADADVILNTAYGVGDSQSMLGIQNQIVTITGTTPGILFDFDEISISGPGAIFFGTSSVQIKGYDVDNNLIASLLVSGLNDISSLVSLGDDFNVLAKATLETLGNANYPWLTAGYDNLEISEYVAPGGGDGGNGGNTVPEPGTLGLLGLGLIGMGYAARKRELSM
ncbi:MAG TPA: PEP-CTERM sorting domain-containing protein [Alphaproteobacteria bacterium]|nr:PEP-CTERM sorting domain-containing protein [Alphaproteobacteria bacterium]HNS45044.1 PEP-CTERM sorting domain-containing protein [Alphaproteobacteria bacterium]